MSTKISDSISNIDTILTNKSRPPKYNKNVQSRLFAPRNKSHCTIFSKTPMRLQSAVAQNSNRPNYQSDFDSTVHLDSQELTVGNYIEQVHGDDTSEEAGDIQYLHEKQ